MKGSGHRVNESPAKGKASEATLFFYMWSVNETHTYRDTRDRKRRGENNVRFNKNGGRQIGVDECTMKKMMVNHGEILSEWRRRK
ncbi:hypothetical protein Csa_019124 [Cucumis sativus]|uniref:Uncharacterized protein n=1 Tax=Cucumis sativus TaxID=3659 RepID=A0A0A0KYB0_CUCSA|nr:hypothetical protein Csa_019124 [Cucumis sativus]